MPNILILAFLGGVSMTTKKNYTKEQLIYWLQDFAEELGKTPTQQELDDEPSMPCKTTYRFYFGNYSNACKKAGLEVNKAGRKRK